MYIKFSSSFSLSYIVPERKLSFSPPAPAGPQARILILEILNVFLRLKFSPSLI